MTRVSAAAQPKLWGDQEALPLIERRPAQLSSVSRRTDTHSSQPPLFSQSDLQQTGGVLVVEQARLTLSLDETSGRWREGDIISSYSQDLLLRAGGSAKEVRRPFTYQNRRYVVVKMYQYARRVPTFIALELVPAAEYRKPTRLNATDLKDPSGVNFDGMFAMCGKEACVLTGSELIVKPDTNFIPPDIPVDPARLKDYICTTPSPSGEEKLAATNCVSGDISSAYSCDLLCRKPATMRQPVQVEGKLYTITAVAPGQFATGYEVVIATEYAGPPERPRLDRCVSPLSTQIFLYTGKRVLYEGAEYIMRGRCRRFVAASKEATTGEWKNPIHPDPPPEGYALITEGETRDGDLIWDGFKWVKIAPAPNQLNPANVEELLGVSRQIISR